MENKITKNILKKITKLNRLNNNLYKGLNPTTIKFIKSLNFDVEAFLSDPNNNYQSSININPIISAYGIFDYINKPINISIADLLGHDTANCYIKYNEKNILYTFEHFFQNNSNSYRTRALGLLKYKSGEQLLRELKINSRNTLDIKIRELEKGKYIIDSNGAHRFTILRFHYLLDRMKHKKTNEELRKAYIIPVKLETITNYKKTYCNYLIQKANPNIDKILFHIKEDKIIICYKLDKKEQTINEEKLIQLARQSINLLDYESISKLINFYYKYDSFHEFINKYIPNLLDKIEIEKRRYTKW